MARVLDTEISTFSAREYGKLYYRNNQWTNIEALKENKGNFNPKMVVTNDIRKKINGELANNLKEQVREIQKPQKHHT